MKIYIADFGYGVPSLSRVEVTKETPLRYYFERGNAESLLGNTWSLGAYIEKDKAFLDGYEAVAHLADLAAKRMIYLRERLEEATQRLNMLIMLRIEMGKEVKEE